MPGLFRNLINNSVEASEFWITFRLQEVLEKALNALFLLNIKWR